MIFVIAAAAVLLAVFVVLLPGHGQAVSVPFTPVTLAAATDLHYIAPELTDGGASFTRTLESGDGKAMAYCEEITEAFVSQVIEKKPDALILSGDLTFNGARASHEALAAKLRLIEDAGIPVLVIPGNHDLNNQMAAAFKGVSYTLVPSTDARQFAAIYGDYGYNEALARDSSSLSYVCELSPGLRVLMLDVNTKDAPGALTDETFHWVQRQLKAARRAGVRVLAVSHQTLLTHNSLISYGFVMEKAERLLSLYEQSGVLCNLSGHMHLQHIARSQGGLTEYATSALLTSPCQYAILELEPSKIKYHTEQTSFPHAAEAEEFFRASSRRMALESMPDADDELIRFFTDVNSAYFAGRMDSFSWDDDLYKKISAKDPYLGFYLKSILTDGFQNHTERQQTPVTEDGQGSGSD